jgi:uncharacterized protein (TIGR00369 family)
VSAARDRLVHATRRLAAAVGRTDVHAEAMLGLAARIEDLVPAVESVVASGVPRTPFEEAVGAAEYTWHVHNPALPGVRMRFAGGVASAELPEGLGHLYEGPVGLVHGGVSAMLMDTMLSSAVQHHGFMTVTATLTTDYRRPIPLGRPLLLTARVEEVAQRKVLASGELSCDGEVRVEARGVFVRVTPAGTGAPARHGP